jgi:divalent metal cation (Fe/Co/Zn/Cd) transporter
LAVGRTANVVIMAMTFNIALTFALFATAAWSGSAALLATAIQSLIAASSQAMVLYGLSRSAPEMNRSTQGTSRSTPTRANEIFFWSFGVAVLLFSLGAGIAIYDGVAKLADPLPNKYLHIAYAVLTGAFVALVMIARLALKQLAPAGPRTSRTARAAQEPAASTVAIESLAGLLGILIAGAGIAIADWLSVPVADGYAAIAIGLLLGVVAAFMSLEIRNLLIGGARADDHLGLSSDNSSAFFIEDETTADPSRSAASAARSASLAPRAPSASATDSERPMSRKERKRHKGKH